MEDGHTPVDEEPTPAKASLQGLLARRLPTKVLDVPGVGQITIRGMTRLETLAMGKGDMDLAARERMMLVTAMVDPEIDNRDARAWQEASPAGELEAITNEIARLSGMLREQQKEETVRFPDGPES